MSGLEVAGVLLGTFPLILSGLEHWRAVARVGGFYRRLGKEYRKCRSDVEYFELQYKANLKELLLPLVANIDEVNRLVDRPGGQDWRSEDLERRMKERLHDSYTLYMGIIEEMNATAEELKNELCFGQGKTLPSIKPSKTASVKSRVDYEAFRVKFSLGEPVRNELLQRLKDYNDRLETLLKTSDRIATLHETAASPSKSSSALEAAYRKLCRHSELLFKAIQSSWECSCWPYHFASLKLEHQTIPKTCFDIVF
ncbi:hypothetical protein M011DRAFT_372357, partial [Sporormia fimetaria CBS 119925]